MSLPSRREESLGETLDLSEAPFSCLASLVPKLPLSSESFFKGAPCQGGEASGPGAAVVLVLVAPRQSDPGRGLKKVSYFLNP